MSLINDALKKRRDAEALQPPPSRGNLDLKPIESNKFLAACKAVVFWSKSFWRVSISIIVILNLGLFLWYAQKRFVTARAVAAEESARAEKAATEAKQQRLAAEQAVAASNAAIAQAEFDRIRSQRPDFRLQGIMFHPTRPSAIINNRSVFVGDRVDRYKVTAISRTQATLATDLDEVTLTLP
jgi:hypothetical protein